MRISKDYITIKQSLAYLAKHGLNYHEMALRNILSKGGIKKTKKIFSSRLIHRSSLDELIERRLADKPQPAELSAK